MQRREVRDSAHNEKGQAPLRHTFGNRPLLPSGPGGVKLLTVAQDLAQTRHLGTYAGRSTFLPAYNGNAVGATPGRWFPARSISYYPSGADRGRTDDLLVANEALSQLSYSPISFIILRSMVHIHGED